MSAKKIYTKLLILAVELIYKSHKSIYEMYLSSRVKLS